jgi:type IV pilus assembly protein PilQ
MRPLPAAALAALAALALAAAITAARSAAADEARAPIGRDFCPRGKLYRGTALDLDVKDADLQEVFRLLADVGRVNIVIAEGVSGKTTLRLKRVPWDQILCTAAASHRLEVWIDGKVLLVRPPAKP